MVLKTTVSLYSRLWKLHSLLASLLMLVFWLNVFVLYCQSVFYAFFVPLCPEEHTVVHLPFFSTWGSKGLDVIHVGMVAKVQHKTRYHNQTTRVLLVAKKRPFLLLHLQLCCNYRKSHALDICDRNQSSKLLAGPVYNYHKWHIHSIWCFMKHPVFWGHTGQADLYVIKGQRTLVKGYAKRDNCAYFDHLKGTGGMQLDSMIRRPL